MNINKFIDFYEVPLYNVMRTLLKQWKGGSRWRFVHQ